VDFVGVGVPPFAHPVFGTGEQHDRDRVGGGLFDGNNGPAASTHYLISYTPSMDSVNVTGSGNTWAAGDTYTQIG